MNCNANEISNNEVTIQNFNNCVEDYVKWQLDEYPELCESLNNLREQGMEFFLQNQIGLDELECPIKTAKKFFREINERTINKAWLNVKLEDYSRSSELLGTEEETLYLISKCKWICSLQGNSDKLSLLIVANIINTLGLDKKIFVDFVNFTSLDLDTRLNPQEIDNLWELSQKQPKCTVCRICCGKDMAVEDVD